MTKKILSCLQKSLLDCFYLFFILLMVFFLFFFLLPTDHVWFIYSFCHGTYFCVTKKFAESATEEQMAVRMQYVLSNYLIRFCLYYDGSVTFTSIVSISLRDCQVYLIIEKNIPRVKQKQKLKRKKSWQTHKMFLTSDSLRLLLRISAKDLVNCIPHILTNLSKHVFPGLTVLKL